MRFTLFHITVRWPVDSTENNIFTHVSEKTNNAQFEVNCGIQFFERFKILINASNN